MAKKKPALTKVASIRHNDKRKNIPTEELRDFVAEDERAPKTILYPRDPSLDPQLVWRGKDEQDRADLAVPVVPIRADWGRECASGAMLDGCGIWERELHHSDVQNTRKGERLKFDSIDVYAGEWIHGVG